MTEDVDIVDKSTAVPREVEPKQEERWIFAKDENEGRTTTNPLLDLTRMRGRALVCLVVRD